MASPLRALSATLLLLAIALVNCEAKLSAIHAIGRQLSEHTQPVIPYKPKFKAGPWTKARATFYDGSTSSFGGACDYKDVVAEGYGLNTAAVSETLFKKGEACGACYEIKCVEDPKWCKSGSLRVTATDLCPPNPSQPSDNGGWCNPPLEHFDIAKPVFSQLADHTAGVIPVKYRRVPCKKKGGIRFTILGNPWFNQVIVWNVGGAGDVICLEVKGKDKGNKWIKFERDWGSTWKCSAHLVGEALSFRVQTSDGKYSISSKCAPKNWQFGQTFEGKNFK